MAGFFADRPWLASLTVTLSLESVLDDRGVRFDGECIQVDAVSCVPNAQGEVPLVAVNDDGANLHSAMLPMCEATLESLHPYVGCRVATLALHRGDFGDLLRVNGSGRQAFEVVRAALVQELPPAEALEAMTSGVRSGPGQCVGRVDVDARAEEVVEADRLGRRGAG